MKFYGRPGIGIWLVALAACGGDVIDPADNAVTVAVQSGDDQFGTPSGVVLDPLQVVVTNPVSDEPMENISISWVVVSGSAAVVTPAQSTTDENGIATATLRLGSALGTYEVEARANRMVGGPARFTAHAVNAPSITNAPTITNVGDTITLTGTNFSPLPDDNLVLFGGFRGRVVSATATQLRVAVPLCVPARQVPLTASLGAISSPVITIEVRGSTTTPLQIARGEVRAITDPAELACIQLPGGTTNYEALLIPQNVSDVASSLITIQLSGLSAGGPQVNLLSRVRADVTTSVPLAFETRLRLREQQMLKAFGTANARPQPQPSAQAVCPAPVVGSRCTFQVINVNDEFQSVSAELKVISTRALIYQDLNAPPNGLTTTDFQTLAGRFDDPIYSAVTSAFGNPTDLDANARIIILLTPIVNAMTPRNSSGFIAGFFYGCDLVSRSACTGTNSAEIFYTLTADPTGQFSNSRTVSSVMNSLPPVLAHEFQHMINFGVRNSTDALWLSEGMAHHAEDVVADVYAARGDATEAAQFRAQNYLRSVRYLRDPAATSLIAEGGTGTLELRGAAWLFVKYLVGQYGQTILRNLTSASNSSVTNVVQQTGRSWSSLLGNWAVALYADDAPELVGATVAPQYTFPNINLRAVLTDFGTYALRPATESFSDFTFRETLPASSQAYLDVRATQTNPQAMSLNLAGPLGGAFPINATPQLMLLRLR
jgi:hypothetical protein